MGNLSFRNPAFQAMACASILFLVSVYAAIAQPFSFHNVPIDTAIENLARQANINFIFSPRFASNMDAAGKPAPMPTITYEGDAAANELLAKILQEHGLAMTKDPVTTVTRIAFTNELVKTVDASLLAGDTNAPIPIIAFSDVPLGVGLEQIAQDGKLSLVLAPELSDGVRAPDGSFVSPPQVSIRWQNLTARQALLALCVNYNLSIAVDEKNGAWRVSKKG